MSLQELELIEIKPGDKAPPESRLKDVQSAHSIYTLLDNANDQRSVARTRIQAMFDGEPPYNQAKLNSTGQGGRCNLNFGEAARHLDTATAGFVDLINSVQTLVCVYTTLGEAPQVSRDSAIIAEEVTRQMRSSPSFHSGFLRLAVEFLQHGVGVAYFPDCHDWHYQTCGLGDVRIPQQTVASEDAIDIMFSRRDYMTHELWEFIKDEKESESAGWDRNEVLRVIHTATSNRSATTRPTDYDRLQREIRNNDLYHGLTAKVVPVIHAWVKEYDGTISHYLFAENLPESFMFSKRSRYKSSDNAFMFFTYGIGTNGTYHSVRGLGAKIFPHVQVSNRLRCQAVDGAMLASSVMLQPETNRALDELALTYYGPYAIMSPGVNIVEKAIPDLTKSVIPVLSDMGMQMSQNLDFYTHDQRAPEQAYRNQLAVEAELELATRLSTATLNLFYVSWNRLMREATKRILADASLPCRKRILDRGVTIEAIESVDHDKTHAVRAVGSGSQSMRSGAMRELSELSPRLDEVGQLNVLRDRIASRVGYELAGRYVNMEDAPRETTDEKFASLENSLMLMNRPAVVNGTDLHKSHLNRHVPELLKIIEGVNAGQIDPMQVLDGLTLLYGHSAEHLEKLSADPTQTPFINQLRQVMQQSEEIIMNFTRKREAEARKAEQQSGSQAQAQSAPNDLQAQEAQLRMQIMKQKAETEIQLARAKYERDTALMDAEQAMKLRSMAGGS